MSLHPLSLRDHPLVNRALRTFPPVISELTFTNLYAWRQTRPILLDTFKDTLLIFMETKEGLILEGNPVGPASLAEVIAGYGGRIRGVDRFPAALLAGVTLPGEAMIIVDRDNADYVYRRENLALLAGGNFTKKRNHVNQCLAAYPCRYEEITPETVDECLDMQERWCAARDCRGEPGLSGENQAIEETLRHYREFGLIGGAIRIDGRIEAFTVGEALNATTAVCHFEKAMPQFAGLGQLINQWFAGKSLGEFLFVNREQDLGIPGLRQAKESYHPDHLVEKVRIVLPG